VFFLSWYPAIPATREFSQTGEETLARIGIRSSHFHRASKYVLVNVPKIETPIEKSGKIYDAVLSCNLHE